MKIKAIQEVTLIDYPGEIACTLFFYGCNFRCGFCHNPELVLKSNEKDYSKDTILKFLKKRQGELEGVCITGGEPLMTLEKSFLQKIKDLNYLIKLDTNGTFPDKLKELIDNKLIDFISMDVKSSQDKYNEITNSKVNLKNIEKSMKLISNLKNYEFRITILEKFHDEKEIQKIAIWLNKIIGKKPKKFVLQGFKNKGKFIDKKYNKIKDTKENYLKNLKNSIKDYFEEIEIRF
jgi:pyruvate formate lyase activating enzyme